MTQAVARVLIISKRRAIIFVPTSHATVAGNGVLEGKVVCARREGYIRKRKRIIGDAVRAESGTRSTRRRSGCYRRRRSTGNIAAESGAPDRPVHAVIVAPRSVHTPNTTLVAVEAVDTVNESVGDQP